MGTLEGQSIHGYEFGAMLASGGFSEVYSAHKVEDENQLAIKHLLPDKVVDDTYLERFRVESEVVTQLNNPHIIPIYDHWSDENGLFMVMKWMQNGSLRRRIVAGGTRDLVVVRRIVRQISSALGAAHNHGLVHRDVKPDNIMFDAEDNAYLADFGLAKNLNQQARLTRTGWQLGSQAYFAPEQITNGEITAQTDIFAFGLLVFETLTGAHPFVDDEGDNFKWMIRTIREPMPLAHTFFSEIPEAVDVVLQKATEKAPADRYATMTEFAQAFEAVLPAISSDTSTKPETCEIPIETPAPAEPERKGFFGRFFKKS